MSFLLLLRELALTYLHNTVRHRHLLNDLNSLLPHSRKEAKFDTKSRLYQLNELAELYNCNNVLFFEARKGGKDLYAWMSKAPNGPTVKMHLQNRKPKQLDADPAKSTGLETANSKVQYIQWRNYT